MSAAYVDEFKAAAKRYYDAARAVRVAADTPDAAVPVTERDEAWDEFCKLTRRPDVMDAVIKTLEADSHPDYEPGAPKSRERHGPGTPLREEIGA